jgi:hypothetical protein
MQKRSAGLLETYHHKEKGITVKPGAVVYVSDTLHNTNGFKLLFVVQLQMTTKSKKTNATEEDEKHVQFWGILLLYFIHSKTISPGFNVLTWKHLDESIAKDILNVSAIS